MPTSWAPHACLSTLDGGQAAVHLENEHAWSSAHRTGDVRDRRESLDTGRAMIQRLVAFALHQRFITLALAALLTAGGIASFYRLPIEPYPDVADVEVDVITIWPGHAAEEVERLVTIALEKELNGVANLTFLRSISIFGLSNIRVLFA